MRNRKKLLALIEQRKRLNKQILKEAKRVFSNGDRVYFTKWNHEISATMLSGFEYHESCRVRSDTGKEYNVDLFWLL